MDRAMRSRASHLAVAFMMFLFFLVAASTLIYLIEGDGQPDQFGSIPRSLWWTSVTMTTVGYGDAVPATALGKLVGSLISIGGIVLIAIRPGSWRRRSRRVRRGGKAARRGGVGEPEGEGRG